MSIIPPLGGVRPAGDQTCGRLLGMSAGGELHCGAPAVTHIAWTSDAENGLVCAEHEREAERRWVFWDRHPLTPLCASATDERPVVWVASWESPPGFCAERVGDGVVYHEVFEPVPAEVTG